MERAEILEASFLDELEKIARGGLFKSMFSKAVLGAGLAGGVVAGGPHVAAKAIRAVQPKKLPVGEQPIKGPTSQEAMRDILKGIEGSGHALSQGKNPKKIVKAWNKPFRKSLDKRKYEASVECVKRIKSQKREPRLWAKKGKKNWPVPHRQRGIIPR